MGSSDRHQPQGLLFRRTDCHGGLNAAGRGGAIVNTASILGHRVAGNVSAYAASKGGLVHVTHALALEWARYGIRVNALCPGYIETSSNRDFFVCEAGSALLTRIPQRRLGRLKPIVDGKVRSSFVMTEPHPRGGSDPSMMLTTAIRDTGRRPLRDPRSQLVITGAQEAQHFILLARTSNDPRKGLTAFPFNRDPPGWRIERCIQIMGPEEHGGHCELVFDELEVPAKSA